MKTINHFFALNVLVFNMFINYQLSFAFLCASFVIFCEPIIQLKISVKIKSLSFKSVCEFFKRTSINETNTDK